MPKIAFLNIDYSMGGGVERVTADLIDLFISKGENVSHLFSLFQRNEKAAVDFSNDLHIHVTGPLKTVEQQTSFVNRLLAEKVDVLIYQADNMSISLAILACAKKARIKAIGHYHGSPYAYLRKYTDAKRSNWTKRLFSTLMYPFKKKKLKRFLVASESGLVCVSAHVKKELETIFPTDKFNLHSILNPLRFVDESYSVTPKKPVITLVSRLETAHKNAFLAVLAWDKIATKHTDWTMRFLGTGALEKEMKDHFFSKGIRNVEFLGFRKDVGALLAESSIGISTSNCEGFSMAVLEYILQDNAVVVTNSDGGVHDMIINDVSGLIVKRNNVNALASALEGLIEDHNKRTTLVKNARVRIAEMYEKDIYLQWQILIQ